MADFSFFLTQKAYQQALTSASELAKIQLEFVNELADRQRDFLTSWWQQQLEQTKTFATSKDFTEMVENVQKASVENADLLQSHAKETLELLNNSSQAVRGWYEKQLSPEEPVAAKVDLPTTRSAKRPPVRVA